MTRSNYTVVSEADGVTKEDGTEAVEGEEIEIDADRIVKGFRYGCSLIPVTDADEEAMKIATQKCLKIVGEEHFSVFVENFTEFSKMKHEEFSDKDSLLPPFRGVDAEDADLFL